MVKLFEDKECEHLIEEGGGSILDMLTKGTYEPGHLITFKAYRTPGLTAKGWLGWLPAADNFHGSWVRKQNVMSFSNIGKDKNELHLCVDETNSNVLGFNSASLL
jgi:hypothetical protein